jgi:tetratricopeptide (TPR) repeat protein
MASYGIIFYMLTLFIVSNLLFSVGTFMNERFIYMPSLGFALVIAWLMVEKLPLLIKNDTKYKSVIRWSLVTILFLFTVRTYTRNFVWKDNLTLFTTDVHVSENSIKCNVSAGGDLQKKAMAETDPVKQEEDYQLSVKYLEKAISIYPKAGNGLLLYGNVISLYKKDHKLAIEQYFKLLEFDPYNNNAFSNTMLVLGSLDNATETPYKISVLKRLYAVNPENADVNYNLGKLYGQFRGMPDSASFYLERAISINPGNIAVYKDLGIVYSMKGEYSRAMDVFTRAQKIDPGDQQILQNIMITQRIMDQNKK